MALRGKAAVRAIMTLHEIAVKGETEGVLATALAKLVAKRVEGGRGLGAFVDETVEAAIRRLTASEDECEADFIAETGAASVGLQRSGSKG